ncbi:hypothetical protein L1987_45405 [Smallanthus sonchifolius]|uniref:Uncharacterized protein n=1 Tax=Smallanthus sonchifolius TaxID=185202 RepID=A0ACB9FWW6_9ASTR|nr:hypothetical protein L1987_45405 [Smallanthus sonchifolius]
MMNTVSLAIDAKEKKQIPMMQLSNESNIDPEFDPFNPFNVHRKYLVFQRVDDYQMTLKDWEVYRALVEARVEEAERETKRKRDGTHQNPIVQVGTERIIDPEFDPFNVHNNFLILDTGDGFGQLLALEYWESMRAFVDIRVKQAERETKRARAIATWDWENVVDLTKSPEHGEAVDFDVNETGDFNNTNAVDSV